MSSSNANCAVCKGKISTKDYLSCSSCKSLYDILCSGLGEKRFKALDKDGKKNWVCEVCRIKQPKHDKTPAQGHQSKAPGIPASKSTEESSPSHVNTDRRKNRAPPSIEDNDCTGDQTLVTEKRLREILRHEMKTVLNSSIQQIVATELSAINKLVTSFQESMDFFSKQFDDLKSRLEEKSATVEKLQRDNEQLMSTVKDLGQRINLAEQHLRESNVEINGIPEHRSENLLTTLNQLAKTVDSPLIDGDILHVTRVAKIDKDSNRPRAVIVKLRSPRCRDGLLAAVTKFNKTNSKEKLSSQHLGIAGPPLPIYVSEHLTPSNKSLHAAARKRAKEMSFRFVWIRNGRIFARKDENSQAIMIRNHDSIKNIN